MSFLWDCWHQIEAVVAGWDVVTMAIAAILILAAGLAIRSFGALLNATLVALIGFGIAQFIRGVVQGGTDPGALARTGWQNFLALTMPVLLTYVVCFALLIAIIHAIRSLITGD